MTRVRISEEEFTFKALDEAWNRAAVVDNFELTADRYVIISDLHKGDKKRGSDDFLPNELIFCHALQWYFDHDYHLVLNGDVEEGWEAGYSNIIKAYHDGAFAAERLFAQKPGYHFRTYGNHDLEWADETLVQKYLWPILGEIKVHPAIRLGENIFIVHGHQGDPQSDQKSKASRFWVKHIWRPLQEWGLTAILWEPLQRLGLVNSPRAAQNNFIRFRRDNYLYQWAQQKGVVLVAGHTHRGIFRSYSKIDQLKEILKELKDQLKMDANHSNYYQLLASIRYVERTIKDSRDALRREKMQEKADLAPAYFNCGCCIYTNGITAIEVDRGMIRLVKWELDDSYCEGGQERRPESFVTIDRKIYETGNLESILKEIKGG